MYQEVFRLAEAPFDITPNPRFLFYSAKHREAFNHLLYGIRERKGFVQLTGEVGAGKTTLCRAALEQLDQHYTTALILNPMMSADELIRAIALEFCLPVTGLDRLTTMGVINQFLLQQVERGKDTVLIIDEAQDLTDDLLELRVKGALPRMEALKSVVDMHGVNFMATICAICKAQFTKIMPIYGFDRRMVGGVHQLVSNAIILGDK